jgi:hypothetical protein
MCLGCRIAADDNADKQIALAVECIDAKQTLSTALADFNYKPSEETLAILEQAQDVCYSAEKAAEDGGANI